MCGIAAIITASDALSPDVIQNMVQVLTHRGPDAQTWTYLPGCHLGHTRLSIIDLAGGQQPMADETNRYWIVFNGEIYNYRDLRDSLLKNGCQFKTQSDTEVILQAYKIYGERLPHHLNGQFAFVIWDSQDHTLFAARDRFGEKPFYYAVTDDGSLLIASEIKAILSSGLIEPRLSLTTVNAYLALLYIPSNRTIYENVKALSAGHQLTWRNNQMLISAYWHPRFDEKPISLDDAADELSSKLHTAVYRQMVAADVPVGALLSGGIDSSTIVALMQKQSPKPIKTFSVGFGKLIDELPYARSIANRYGTDHYELQMDIDVAQAIQCMVSLYDEPFADSSSIPTYMIAEFARRQVKVVLSGDGGDELFGGYGWYAALLESETTSRSWLYLMLLRIALRVSRFIAPKNSPALVHKIMAAKLARTNQADMWDKHRAQIAYLSPSESSQLWGKRAQEAMATDPLEAFHPDDSVTSVNRASYFDVLCYLTGDILTKVDRATMAYGLESRTPYLDVDLAEFALSLPYRLKIDDRGGKAILRKVSAELLPAQVINRPKHGFGAPVTVWLRKPEMQSLLERILAPTSPLSYLFPGLSAKDSRGYYRGWILLCLGLWLEKHPECLRHL